MADRTQTAVQTLSATDPEFREMTHMLYGPGVDADAIWADVYGGEVAKLSHKLLEGIGIAGSVVGGGIAAKEVAQGVNALRGGQAAESAVKDIQGAGKLVQVKQALKSPAGKIATGTTALGTDAIATVNQAGTPKKQPVPVTKAVFPKFDDHVAGFIKGARSAGKHAAPRPQPGTAFGEGAARIGNAIDHKLGTTHGTKIAVGATGGVLLAAHHERAKGRKQAAQAEYDYEVGKGDYAEFEAVGTFSKFDDAQRLAFGWASVVSKDGVDVVDRQGDVLDIDDLERAAYAYVHTSRVGGDMHRRAGEDPHHVSDLVESIVITPEKLKGMGLAADALPTGWWVGYKIHDEPTWELVKKGERTGFSIHGKGIRKMVEVDD